MSTKPSNQPAPLERDPVCGMNVNPATAKHAYEHAGKNYYFCCAACVEKFKADPAKYLKIPPAAPSGLVMLGAAKAAHPVHHCTSGGKPDPALTANANASPSLRLPHVPRGQRKQARRVPFLRNGARTRCSRRLHAHRVHLPHASGDRAARPGSCPICGMALEPRTVTASAEENPELRDMTRRFWVSLALTVPLIAACDMYGRRIHGRPRGTVATSDTWRRSAWLELVAGHARRALGRAGRSSSASGLRSSIAARTCSR